MDVRPVPHEGFLHVVSWQGQPYLYHQITGEVAKLPEGDWNLRFDDQGQGVLENSSQDAFEWAHRFLKLHVGELEDGTMVELRKVNGCVQRSHVTKPFQEEQQRVHRAYLPVPRGLGALSSDFEVFVSATAVHGSYMWWSLPCVYNAIGGKKHRSWYAFRGGSWSRWRTVCEEVVGLGPCSLLRALPKENEDMQWPFCPFQWAAANTFALIVILVRMVGPWTQNGRSDALQPAAEELLEDLFRTLPQHFTLEVRRGAAWLPPYGLQGGSDKDKLTFVVQHGRIDLQSPRHQQPRMFADNFLQLEDLDECGVLQLLESDPLVSACNSKRVGFLPSLVWQLGALLEVQLLQQPPEILSSRQWFGNSPLRALDLSDFSQAERFAALRSYGDLNDEALWRCQVVALALDDSRVGRRNWKLAVAACPEEDLVFWLFPQAPGGH